MKVLTEFYGHLVKGLDAVADAFAGTVRSEVVNMEAFGRALFVLHKGVGTTGTSTITMEASDDVSATNVTAIPFRYRICTTGDTWGALTDAAAAGFATTAGSSQLYAIEVDAAELGDTGYNFLSMKCVEVVNDPVLGGILIFLHEPRYGQAISATAIT